MADAVAKDVTEAIEGMRDESVEKELLVFDSWNWCWR